MARYIDAEKFEKDIIGKAKVLNDEIVFESNFVYSTLYQQPTSDVVKVVRCKDCKYCRGIKDLILPITNRFCCYRPNNFAVEENDYCSYGERKCEGK